MLFSRVDTMQQPIGQKRLAFVQLVSFEVRSHIAKAGLELVAKPRMTLNF